jgi:hypothetical protein
MALPLPFSADVGPAVAVGVGLAAGLVAGPAVGVEDRSTSYSTSSSWIEEIGLMSRDRGVVGLRDNIDDCDLVILDVILFYKKIGIIIICIVCRNTSQ